MREAPAGRAALLAVALVAVSILFPVARCKHAFSTVVFEDDFDDLDLAKWKHEITLGGGGNWEFEYYTNNRTNSYVRSGILYIKPTLTADYIGESNLLNGYTMDLWGSEPAAMCTGNAFYGCSRMSGGGGNILNPIQSARLRTAESFNFQYGHVEIRAKLPRGDWIWPAIWLLPTYNQYGNWPASGEIDIIESRGNPKYDGGSNTVSSTLHWGPFYPLDPYYLTHDAKTLASGDFADDFHVFGFFWNETLMYTYLDTDDNRILEVPIKQSFWERGGWDKSNFDNPWQGRGPNAPFDRKFFLILNVAVGGTNGYFPDGVGNKPWSNTDPHAVNAFWNARNQWLDTWQGEDAALQIDYVRIWQ